jgi:3-oxoacyl-(acyl-carrier-protein) synthase
MGQLDKDGFGALFQNPMCGKRPTSKNAALGLTQMPGDFVNAYVLGSIGESGGIVGACATFLYNLRLGVEEIKSGRKRLVIIGNSEAPVVPDVIEAYRTMGALAEDEQLMALDNSDSPDYRRACRPFSSNSGFTVAESSVFTVLMDDELAAALGTWEYGLMPGITTIDHIAEDVEDSHLNLPMSHLEIDPQELEGAFVNSKGFGGNNATGFFLSPKVTEKMLVQRWGAKQMQTYRKLNDQVASKAADYDAAADSGRFPPIYDFGEGVIDGEDLDINSNRIVVPGFGHPVNLDLDNPYNDMTG